MNWQPSASLETLRARAQLLARIRGFFAERGVLEVDTPMLSAHATVDRHIESFRTVNGWWLHTSPEFAMKRLLAAGSGPVYQLCHVFRQEESGRHHNPEFLMLEWYRPGFDHHALMTEVEHLLASAGGPASCERLSYRDAFLHHAGFDPHAAPLDRLREGVQAPADLTPEESADRDFWLDLWMSWVIGPRLGQDRPCLLYDYPASQAALARVRLEDPANGIAVAERFELYWRGVELANGFHELTDAAEQQRRFAADQAWRRDHGRTVPPYDARLIAALQAGLPASAGVAVGVDRLLMLLLNLPEVRSALAFDGERA